MNSRADIFLWGLLFGAIVVWQALYPSRLLASKFMEFLGERSYSIYLIHPFVIYWLGSSNRILNQQASAIIGNWAFIANGIFTLIVVVLCAMLTYRFIEVPGIGLGKKLIARMK